MDLEQLPEEKVRRFFGDKLVDEVNGGEIRDLFFLIVGEKPGSLIMGADSSALDALKEFSEAFGLNIKVVEGGERSLLDRLIGRDNRFEKESVYLAQKEERFNILENSEGRFNGFSDKAVGEFLGYPESAVEYYVQKTTDEPAGMEFHDTIEKLIESGNISQEERESLECLSYLPAPREKQIMNAVNEGTRRQKLLEEAEELFDLDSLTPST